MVKIITCKCIIYSCLFLGPAVFAGEFKTSKVSRSLTIVPKAKKSHFNKKMLLEKVNLILGDSVDFSFFDKKRVGVSVYAKVSKVSKVGVRYRF